jgi:hypothetical protein
LTTYSALSTFTRNEPCAELGGNWTFPVAAICYGERGGRKDSFSRWNQKVTFESSAFAQHPLSYKHILWQPFQKSLSAIPEALR